MCTKLWLSVSCGWLTEFVYFPRNLLFQNFEGRTLYLKAQQPHFQSTWNQHSKLTWDHPHTAWIFNISFFDLTNLVRLEFFWLQKNIQMCRIRWNFARGLKKNLSFYDFTQFLERIFFHTGHEQFCNQITLFLLSYHPQFSTLCSISISGRYFLLLSLSVQCLAH